MNEISSNSHTYALSKQIGYLLRMANQRHLEIFHRHLPELTPTQFALLVKLDELGDTSQNELGRNVGIDAATTNGVIDRLLKKRFIKSIADPADKRRLRISLTPAGEKKLSELIPVAKTITRDTLNGLSTDESEQLIRLLEKLRGL